MSSPLTFSFELFPPRTPEAQAKLPAVIGQLAALGPNFFSVTHGAGGSDQEGTYETLLTVVEHSGVETAPHLLSLIHIFLDDREGLRVKHRHRL